MQRHGIENTVQVPFLSGLADQFERGLRPSGGNVRAVECPSQSRPRASNRLKDLA
jgi:hypothetical protein